MEIDIVQEDSAQPDEDNDKLISDAIMTATSLISSGNIDNLIEAENVIMTIIDKSNPSDKIMLDAMLSEINSTIKDKTERISDSFEGRILEFTKNSENTVFFVAQTGKVNIPNLNKRIYTKEDFEKNFSRAKRYMKNGGFVGYSGHKYGLFSSDDGPHNICIKWTDAHLDGDDVIQYGELILNSVGKEILSLWDAGVNIEFSWVGYGRLEPEDKAKYEKDPWGYKGNFYVKDYIWDGTDLVTRGAASTKTLQIGKKPNTDSHLSRDSLQCDGTEIQENAQIVEQESQEVTMSDSIVDVTDEPLDVQDTNESSAAPEPKGVQFDSMSLQKLAGEFVEQQFAAMLLSQKKKSAIESLGDFDSDFIGVIRKSIDDAQSIEEVEKITGILAPKLSALKHGENIPTGIAVIDRKKTYEKNWIVGDAIMERPDTISGVRSSLVDGLPGDVNEAGTMKWAFDKLLDNYEASHPEYLYACTKAGIKETATTSSVLGTTQPQVLPLLRKLYPKLVAYEICTVMPITQPTATVYTLDIQNVNDSNHSLSDSTYFDSGTSNHTEGNTKVQIRPYFTQANVVAYDKAIYYDITSRLAQDAKAQHNIDVEKELLSAAADQIARELNYWLLGSILAGATASSQEYGTTMPTGYTSDLEWYRALSLFIAKVGGKIGEKTYESANYLVVSPDVAPLLVATKDYLKFDVPERWGAGLRGTGVFSSTYKVFVAEWFTAGTILVICKGTNWLQSGAVFAPYIPLYISPADYVPSNNTMSRSLSSRNAVAVLNGNFYGTVSVKFGQQGVAPF